MNDTIIACKDSREAAFAQLAQVDGMDLVRITRILNAAKAQGEVMTGPDAVRVTCQDGVYTVTR
jgi:hypothetical protein